ncbi:hypothetical protein ACLKA7_001775 [Drosophila subpalustris]
MRATRQEPLDMDCLLSMRPKTTEQKTHHVRLRSVRGGNAEPSYSRGCSLAKAVRSPCRLVLPYCVREDAALVVAGMIPLGLLAAERQTGTLVNRALRERETISRWQRKWEQASSGVDETTNPRAETLDRAQTWADPYCDHCGGDVIEDAEHSVFHCPLFTQERELAAGPNTPLTPGNLVATMIATEHGWAAISTMPSIIMKELRRRERSRREHSQTSGQHASLHPSSRSGADR